jgi:hypothetical protein
VNGWFVSERHIQVLPATAWVKRKADFILLAHDGPHLTGLHFARARKICFYRGLID